MNKIRFTLLVAVFTAITFIFFACSSDNGSSDNGNVLNGTYVNQNNPSYKIVITGNYWVSIRNNENYGKGTYTLETNYVMIARSTHAWYNGVWIEYTMDVISGIYEESPFSFTITSTTGNDYNFLGEYKKAD
jgi:hypothetical protein